VVGSARGTTVISAATSATASSVLPVSGSPAASFVCASGCGC
jgi:hypothetical protein